jgi:hypothetical protein
MTNHGESCRSCVLLRARRLIDDRGEGQVVLGTGGAEAGVRCVAAGGRLLLLVHDGGPLTQATASSPDDVVAQVGIDDEASMSLRMLGWAACLHGSFRNTMADAFADRHPTTDLLDLGRGYELLMFEPVEAHVHCGQKLLRMDDEQLQSLLSLVPDRA